MQPLISCICLSSQRPGFLAHAIESFLSQTYPNKELIVVLHPDDEPSQKLVGEYNTPSIKHYVVEKMPLDKLRNFAIEQSSGEYFCIWNDDDWHHIRRLELQFSQMELNGKSASVLAYCILFDAGRKHAYQSFPFIWGQTLLCSKSIFDCGVRYWGTGIDAEMDFLRKLMDVNCIFPVLMPSLYVYVYHGANAGSADYFGYLFAKSQKLSSSAANIINDAVSGKHDKITASQLLLKDGLTSSFNFLNAIPINYSYREQDARLLERLSGRTVLNGPFKGLKYPAFDEYEAITASAVVPKLIGCYENELSEIIAEVMQNNYTEILNIGCAEGYYANGLALKCSSPAIYAFDTDNRLREICADMAKINNVDDRVHVRSTCTSEILEDFPFSGRGLIICDCEGYEYELFQESTIPNLQNCDLLIEVHDHININITPKLEALFRDTHQITTVKSIDDLEKVKLYNFPPFEDITDREEKKFLYAEHRPCVMEWIWLKSNQAAEKITMTI